MSPILETDRLILRVPSAEDLPAWCAFLADAEATGFIGGPQDAAGAWRNLSLFIGSWTLAGISNFSVIEKASGRWIGRAGPWFPPGWPGREIGWAFDRSAWGKGFATEAAARCLDHAFTDLGWDDAVHVIDPGNTGSIAVARRLGAVRSGTHGADDLYRTSPAAWQRARSAMRSAPDRA